MYVNSVELLFWADHTKLAQWMKIDEGKGDDALGEPERKKLVTAGQSYQEALEGLLPQLEKNGITLEDGLAVQMIEAAIERDHTEGPTEAEQVFLGILANTVH